MSRGRLSRLADRLDVAGIDAGQLRALQQELDALHEPPETFVARMTERAKMLARRHWRHFVEEVRESREVMAILATRARKERDLTEEERDRVRSQLFDALRAVPASLIVVGNWLQPIPGTSFLTPWVLSRLGLLPSRWREAHLLDQLEAEEKRLRREGHAELADRLHAIEDAIEDEADRRELAAKRAVLLARWDADGDGEWSDDERQTYRAEVDRLQVEAIQAGHQRRWFLHGAGQVFGPVRLSGFVTVDAALPLLVCLDADGGWVALSDLLDQPNRRNGA